MAIKLQGMDQLLRQIDNLQGVEQAKEKALEAGAEHMRKEIAKATPRSNLNKPHAADNIVKEKEGDQIIVGPHKDHFYMKFIELGTSKLPAKPFMGPAYERNIQQTQEMMKEKIRSELNL
ncbi:HK97-gp10 family putative phage morphogenesis protein [Pseudobacillus badius]|uniref:HK97-gp10 family putative phage morphogenesis protein n=1 Tax=Bacillus badius TaxID=1455 RepID=UPI0007B36F88|nr:HK97-gp10 family putative phage morphogenesis protein [Bacillus badius]KZR60389.1 hypothetical protein A3781_09460 [Bacillus badius]